MKRPSISNKIREALAQWTDIRQLRQHEDKALLVLTLMIGDSVGLVIVAFILLTENLCAHVPCWWSCLEARSCAGCMFPGYRFSFASIFS
jgi:hypothetical protein